jgi:hypothetical protein
VISKRCNIAPAVLTDDSLGLDELCVVGTFLPTRQDSPRQNIETPNSETPSLITQPGGGPLDLIAMLESKELIIISSYFVGFISGIFCAAFYQYLRHNAPEVRSARLAAAEGEPRHDGKTRSMNLPAVLTALGAVSGLIVVDHFKGPLFPDVFYCLNDGGTQTTRMCTGRVPP